MKGSDKRIAEMSLASDKRFGDLMASVKDNSIASDKRFGDLIASMKELRTAENTLTLSKISQLEAKLNGVKVD